MSTCLKNNRAFIQGLSSAPTDTNLEAGDIYYNTVDDIMYRYNQSGDWVPLGSGGKVTVSSSAPANARANDGWFDTGSTGLLYVYNGNAWVQVLDPKDANTTSVSTTAPSTPVTGDFWVDTSSDNSLKLYNGSTWVTVTTPPAAIGALDDLTDITNSGSNEQVLTSNGNGTYTFTDSTTELKALTDIPTPQPNQFLNANTFVFNGTDYGFVERVKQFQDLSDVDAYTGNNQESVLQYDGDGTYSWVTNEHQLEDLTNVDGSTNAGYILAADGDGTYSFQQPAAGVTVGATAPTVANTSDDIGKLWLDTSDTGAAGLYIWSGTNWVSTNGGAMPGPAEPVTLDSSATGSTTINSFTTFQEIRTSDYIDDGGTFEISSDVWIWSDDTSVAALIIDTPNATVVNNGKIIGKGGNGRGQNQGLQDGGPAISVTASGVTIDNASGAYIAGGGGGGGGSGYGPGGGGAGGGQGGDRRNAAAGGVGGSINSVGGNGTGWSTAYGGGAGGGGGYSDESSSGNQYGYSAGGGGRILPGTGGEHVGGRSGLSPPVGVGGSAGNAGNNGASQGNGIRGAGGGGWGASGGTFFSVTGGAGGAAVSGSYTQGTWAGTVYGSS